MGERDKLPIRIERDRMRWKEAALLTFLQQSRLFYQYFLTSASACTSDK